MDFATITNIQDYTVFCFNDYTIRFKAPHALEYYDSIKEWNNGYIVLNAKYKHNQSLEEEYIDLIPIAKKIYIDAEEFLKQIKM